MFDVGLPPVDAAFPPFDTGAPPFDASPGPLAFDAQLGMFSCGGAQCNAESQFCQMGSGTESKCAPFPAACKGTPDCSCLQQVFSAPMCSGDNGGLTLTMPPLPALPALPPTPPAP
jgi:hypothetical protein